MGKSGGSNVSSTLPPPPTPTIQYDPSTTAAENALAAQAKQSFASTVETDDEKAEKSTLGKSSVATEQTGNPALTQQQKKRPRIDPASMMAAGSMGTSAVLTG